MPATVWKLSASLISSLSFPIRGRSWAKRYICFLRANMMALMTWDWARVVAARLVGVEQLAGRGMV